MVWTRKDGLAICWRDPSPPFRSWPGCMPCPLGTMDCWTVADRVGRNATMRASGDDDVPCWPARLEKFRCWRPKEPNSLRTSSSWKLPLQLRSAAGRYANVASVGDYWQTRLDLQPRTGMVMSQQPIRPTNGEQTAVVTSAIISPS